MISAKHIVQVFRQRGGGDEFTSPAEKLTPARFAYLKTVAAGEPIIAKVTSAKECFVLAESFLVLPSRNKVCRVPFVELCDVEISKSDFRNPRIKTESGSLDVGLQDGTGFRIKVEPGGPYFGLLNVLMRIATINRGPRVRADAEMVS
jgi:hypothetical protein